MGCICSTAVVHPMDTSVFVTPSFSWARPGHTQTDDNATSISKSLSNRDSTSPSVLVPEKRPLSRLVTPLSPQVISRYSRTPVTTHQHVSLCAHTATNRHVFGSNYPLLQSVVREYDINRQLGRYEGGKLSCTWTGMYATRIFHTLQWAIRNRLQSHT